MKLAIITPTEQQIERCVEVLQAVRNEHGGRPGDDLVLHMLTEQLRARARDIMYVFANYAYIVDGQHD